MSCWSMAIVWSSSRKANAFVCPSAILIPKRFRCQKCAFAFLCCDSVRYPLPDRATTEPQSVRRNTSHGLVHKSGPRFGAFD
jgi:hypothetical protein